MTRSRRLWLSVVVAFLVMPAALFAQSASTGAIAGLVVDATGAVLPGVTVEVSSPALIEKTRSAVSDSQGRYQIVQLRPGTYTVTFTLSGFNAFKREGVELTTGFTAVVNAELRVGSVQETVTVSGASPVVDVQNVRQQTVLTREMLDLIPAQKNIQSYAALTVGAVGAANRQDVGGSTGEVNTFISIHGIGGQESVTRFDGVSIQTMVGTGGGANRWLKPNQLMAQEITLQTGGISAESDVGGFAANVISKDGGNVFSFTSLANYTNDKFHANNVTDELRAQNLTTPPKEKLIYDVGAGLGGPIKKDKLWFYTAHRRWVTDEQQAGNYYNMNPNPLFYTPDTSRPAVTSSYARDHSLRLTWQAAAKHKVSFNYSYQEACACLSGLAGSTRAPEAAPDIFLKDVDFAHGVWTYPATGKLLIDAGSSYIDARHEVRPHAPATENSFSVMELSNGILYGLGEASSTGGLSSFNSYTVRADGTMVPNLMYGWSTRYNVSYVTGSHAFKTGLTTLSGKARQSGNMNRPSYQFRNGVPVLLTLYASPALSESRMKMNLGAFAQDQWTIARLTLNLGLRFDYLNGYVPAQTRPGGEYVGPLEIARVDNVPNWKDVSPRIGAAYDVFGNGKTSLKFSLGRYVAHEGTSIAAANNPANAMVLSTNRNWNDTFYPVGDARRGNFVPDCDLKNPAANGECGGYSNTAFGTVQIRSRYSNDALNGFGARPYNWQFNTALQQELRPGIALNVGYYHTSYGNVYVSANRATQPGNYSSYCIPVPVDARLPGGGGKELCGLFDVTPAAFGAVDSLITHASEFGGMTRLYDGFDVTINARLAKALMTGGVSTGRSVNDVCDLAKNHPEVTPTANVPGDPSQSTFSASFGTGSSTEFCRTTLPFEGQTQIKVSGSYPLPVWGLDVAATFQNLPGIPITASHVVTNAQVAPSLRRNLGQCGSAATCNATVTLANLFAPNTVFADRLTQLDVRLSKRIIVRRLRLNAMFDAYNVLNASTVRSLNSRYGTSWLQPVSILPARLFKFGVQVDF